MKRHDDDHDLRALFDDVRAADRRHTPAFEAVWPQADARAMQAPIPHRARAPRLLAALASAAAMIAFAWLALRVPPADPPLTNDEALLIAAAIENWQAPSDELDEHLSGDLLSTIPTLHLDSIPDLEDLEAEGANGDEHSS